MKKKPTSTTRPFGFIPVNYPTPPRPNPASDLPVLEERQCMCGCGRKFRVMSKSPLQFASRDCKTNFDNLKKDQALIRRALKVEEIK